MVILTSEGLRKVLREINATSLAEIGPDRRHSAELRSQLDHQ